LETEIPAELLEEGIIRDFIRQVQSVRKNKGLTPKDRISIVVGGNKEMIEIILKNKDFICEEVLADDLRQEEIGEFEKEFKIQDKEVKISLK